MEQEKKRIFVGNLPPHITEEQITKKFSKYGAVLSIELKKRQDSSTFAFLDLEIKSGVLEHCFTNLTRKPWDGYQVKLDLAKESFLNRLERERQLEKSKTSHKDSLQKAACDKQGSFGERKAIVHKEPEVGYNADVMKDSSSSESSEEEEEVRGNLPMFRGIKRAFPDIYGDSIDEGESNTAPSSGTKHVKLQSENEMLQKFESYSDVWKDSPSSKINASNDNSDYEVETVLKFETKKNIKSKVNNNQSMKESETRRSLIAEEKRLKSIKEKQKAFLQQKQAVKTALATVDSSTRSSKKIIFHDSDGESNLFMETECHIAEPIKKEILVEDTYDNTEKKGKLFSEDESEDEKTDFRIKSQFEGRKGQKLLELQTRYANDKRFTLDERFYESDAEEGDTESIKPSDEKKNQLRILESVLGYDLPMPEEKDVKIKNKSMLRFDPTKPDHLKFELKPNVESPLGKSNATELSVDKSQTKRVKSQVEESQEPTPVVSKEKFYKVADELKKSLQKKSEKNTFSLLEMFGQTDSAKKDEDPQDDDFATIKSKGKQIGWSSNPFKYDSSESEGENEKDVSVSHTTHKQQHAVWHESFFFKPDDIRLQEGLRFLSVKDDIEETDFQQKRWELKKIIRSKIKNNQRQSQKWKKKLGGQKMNRKPNKNIKTRR